MVMRSEESDKKIVVSIVGLTASGKTSFLHDIIQALFLPRDQFITISVDSGAVYRHLNIGTAKPPDREINDYNYRLVNVISPCERYSLARFINDVENVIAKEPHHILFIVGGTPLYFYTLVGESGYVPVEPDYVLRNYLYNLAEDKGNTYLHYLLSQVDPLSAQKIHFNDTKRLIRTLEIVLTLGKMRRYATRYVKLLSNYREFRYIFLPNSDKLRKRIYTRTELMLKNGWIEEVSFLNKYCPPPAPWLEVLGYSSVYQLVQGEIPYEEAFNRIFTDTWRFARRQRTWFRKDKYGKLIATEEDRESARREIVNVINSYRKRRQL